MLKTITPYFVIASCAMHFFCCGLPLLLSITSLTTIFGTSSLHMFELEWFEAIENYVLVFSGVVLLISFVADRFSKKLDCVQDGDCTHPPCTEKKNFSSYMLRVATVLYIVNVSIFAFNTFAYEPSSCCPEHVSH